MMYVPLQVNRFQKIILLIVQYKHLKSCSKDFMLQNLILHTRLCRTCFIAQPSWVSDFRDQYGQSEKICIGGVPVTKSFSAGPALKYFYMIHRVGQSAPKSF